MRGSVTRSGFLSRGGAVSFTGASLARAGSCQRLKLGAPLSRQRQGNRQPVRGGTLGLHLASFKMLDTASPHPRALRQFLLG
jgi:hypothetical protein